MKYGVGNGTRNSPSSTAHCNNMFCSEWALSEGTETFTISTAFIHRDHCVRSCAKNKTGGVYLFNSILDVCVWRYKFTYTYVCLYSYGNDNIVQLKPTNKRGPQDNDIHMAKEMSILRCVTPALWLLLVFLMVT